MKICIDLTSIYDKLSGIERFCLNISKNMILYDKENEYLLIFKKEVHEDFLFIKNKPNVKYKIVNLNNKLLLGQIVLPIVLYLNKCDLYLFLAFPSPLLFFNKNIINTVHDMTPWMYPETMSRKGLVYFRVLIKNAMKQSRLIFTVSNSSKKDIKQYFNINNIEVIYNGVDKKFFQFYDDEEKKDQIKKKYKLPNKYIFSLGTLEPRKNLKLLLNAFVELKQENKIKDYKLVLSGRFGWKYDKLFEIVKDNKLEEEIIFTGFIEDADLPYVYLYSECFVFPSIYEGFGIPPLEAMATGVPVISSDVASMPEVIGDAGIFFKNNNKEDIENKIMQLLNMSKDKIIEIRNKGYKQVEKFKWDNEAKKVLKLLENNK